MLIKVYEENPDPRRVKQIVDCLRKGGVIIYPTDTVYSFGCDLNNHKALEKIARLKGIKTKEAKFSIICFDLSHLSEFAKPLNNHVYKLMKRALPGAFTFLLKASNQVPRIFKSNKKTIGIRVPDNDIARTIVQELGHPIITSSLPEDDEEPEYSTNPELMQEKWGERVEMVIDGGQGRLEYSTVVDCTEEYPELVREGIGDVALVY